MWHHVAMSEILLVKVKTHENEIMPQMFVESLAIIDSRGNQKLLEAGNHRMTPY